MAASGNNEFLMVDVKDGEGLYTCPSNVELDEVERLWAAFERPPSVKQKHHAVLRQLTAHGPAEVVDVRRLDHRARQVLLHKAFATNDQDNTNILSGIKE